MMKKAIQAFLQRLLGFRNYLFLFSLTKIHTLRWEPASKEGDFNHFLTLLDSEKDCLDIGANIGIMTVPLAKRSRRVYAFEPVPDNFATLSRVCGWFRLDNVTLEPKALGEKPGTIEMTMPVLKGVRMQGLSHVSHPSIEGYTDAGETRYPVEQLALDTYPFPSDVKIGGIKMDVENYEQFVLRGGLDLISAHQPIIYCELWPNENREACMEMLNERGYSAWVLAKDDLQPFDDQEHTQHNFFFLPPSAKK